VKVSIILPVYNCEKLVARCINSLLKQEIKDKEIICVDDHSTDNSLKVLKSFSNKIKVYVNPEKGKAKAINFALTKAKGEIIFVAESDAYYSPDYLPRLIRKVSNKKVGGAIGRLKVPNKNKSWMTRTAFKEREKKFEGYKPISAWVFRKKILEKLGGFDSRLRAHDEVILGRLMKERGYEIAYDPKAYWYHNEKETIFQLFKQQMWWGKGYVDTFKYYKWLPKSILVNSFLLFSIVLFLFFNSLIFYPLVWVLYYIFLVVLTKSFSIALLKLLRGFFQTIGFFWALIE